MKELKISLADMLNFLTAIAFGFICFLSKNFSTLGDIYESVAWASFIIISLAGTAFVAKLFKRASRNFRVNFILEIISILLFTGLMCFFSYTSFPHYFNVLAKKTEIQNKLQSSIIQADSMFLEYEKEAQGRIHRYESILRSVLSLKNDSDLAKYGFTNGVPYQSQILHKVSTLQSELLPPNYSDTVSNRGVKEVAQAWLKNAKTISNDWKSIGIVNVVNDIEKNSRKWLNQLESFFQKQQQGETISSFAYPLSFNDVKIYFTTSSKPTMLSICLAAIAYLLMLLSWFITKRHTRRTGISTKAPYEIEL